MKKSYLSYNPKLKLLARKLRKQSTLSEVVLWLHLKNKQMLGFDFDRQKLIGNYIVDFFCRELMLAIEIDGYSHIENFEKDQERQKELEKLGVRFLRFREKDIRVNIEGVLITIKEWIEGNK